MTGVRPGEHLPGSFATQSVPAPGGTPSLLETWGIPASFVLVLLAQKVAALAIAGNPVSWPFGLVDPFCRWDCNWYMALAQFGYAPGIDAGGKANWAFFPLLPATTALLARLTGLTLVQAGTLLSVLATYLAAGAARPLCASRRQFVLLSALLLCGPASLYFSMPYTEAAFVLFTVLVWVNARAGRYVWAGLAGMLLSADRAVGLFAAAVILIAALQRHVREGHPLSGLPAAWWRAPAPLLGAALVPLGLGAFSLYLRWYMGDGLAFLHIQREWGRVAGDPIMAWIYAFISGPLLGSNEERIMAIAALVAGGLAARLALKRDYGMAMFCLAAILVPLGTGLISMLRFVMALAPLWVEAADLGARRRYWFLWLLPILASGVWIQVLWLNDVHVFV